MPKLASELTDLLISGTDQIGEAILGDLVRVHPMASERGRNALLNAAAHRTDIVTRFGELENDEERALWMLLEHGDIFREGEELRFFDYYSEGSRGRHYKTTANLTVSQAEADVSAFRVEVCQFNRRRDGSGVSCEVEFAERHQDKSIQIAVYIQGLPNNGTEFVNGKFVRRVSNPALEAAIVMMQAMATPRRSLRAGRRCMRLFGRHLRGNSLKSSQSSTWLENGNFGSIP